MKDVRELRKDAAPTTVYIHHGGKQSHSQVTAINSPNAAVGDGSTSIDDSNRSIVVISDSFNMRQEQIGKIDELITLLQQEHSVEEDVRKEVVSNLDKVKMALSDSEHPDPSQIATWMNSVKTTLETFVLTKDVIDAFEWVWNSFHQLVK
jgi:hypothetical protein